MPLLQVGVMVAMIILASAIHKYVDRRTKGAVPGDAELRLMARPGQGTRLVLTVPMWSLPDMVRDE